MNRIAIVMAVEKEEAGGHQPPPPPPPPFSGAKMFFSHVKSKNLKFLPVNNIRDFSLFIEQGISDKK